MPFRTGSSAFTYIPKSKRVKLAGSAVIHSRTKCSAIFVDLGFMRSVRWQASQALQAGDAVLNLTEVITFSGGWLLDPASQVKEVAVF
jgi:hypothetical protein